ncbi:MAG: hypothetical protein AAGH15_10635 [Myxococcota bacterium]
MRAIATVIVIAALVAPAAPAGACINAYFDEVATVAALRRAEAALRRGNLRGALRAQRVAWREASVVSMPFEEDGGQQRLVRRARRVLATIVVRAEGTVDPARGRFVPRAGRAARRRHLGWAREQLARDVRSPRGRARHAEALAALGELDAARNVLRELAADDLMPDAWGYRVLARLEAEAGDAEARDAAHAACRARAGAHAQSVCRRPPELTT